MTATTEQTLTERVETLERQMRQLVGGLQEDVLKDDGITRIRWDPDFDHGYPPDEPGPPGAWVVEWCDGTVETW